MALTGKVLALYMLIASGLSEDPAQGLKIAYEAARRAVDLDDTDAWAHLAMAQTRHIAHENVDTAKSCRTALRLNPNLAHAEGTLGLIQAHIGNHDEAIMHVEKALRLSPKDPNQVIWMVACVVAAVVTDRPQEYLKSCLNVTEHAPNFLPGWRHLAAAHANLDQLDAARAAVVEILRIAPDDRIGTLLDVLPLVHPEGRERFLTGLRKAGLPE
ncbi:MAG: tetratricopeptide repeat protein [Alphaproteobacteria bacterium]|nr:tetratricopeptide repeat protein [Alphaproteobacteria bacterium]